MQARVVSGGDFAFNSLLCGIPTQETINFCRASVDSARERLGEAGQHLYNYAANAFNSFSNSEAMRAARAVIANAGERTGADMIRYLDRNTITQARPMMQRYIMVQPDLFKLNHNQMCSAYDGEYDQVNPLGVERAQDHNDYRRVMDGILQHDKGGNAFISYHSDAECDKLELSDQFTVLRTWDVVAGMIADGYDPTDPNGGEL